MMSLWSRSFEGRPESQSEVRAFTRLIAGSRDSAGAVEMVASELAGNAILHSNSGAPGGCFTVQLVSLRDRWHVRVVDEGGVSVPHVCERTPIDTAEEFDAVGDEAQEDLDMFDDEAESGRGLAIVSAISLSWGVLGDQSSRTVWAEVLIPPGGTVVNGAGAATNILQAAS